jgi:hypothetical protein
MQKNSRLNSRRLLGLDYGTDRGITLGCVNHQTTRVEKQQPATSGAGASEAYEGDWVLVFTGLGAKCKTIKISSTGVSWWPRW